MKVRVTGAIPFKRLKPNGMPVRKHQVHKNKKKLIPRKRKYR